jgi:hypothetical protein
MVLNYMLLLLVNIYGLASFDIMWCILVLYRVRATDFLFQEEPCDTATVKEELPEEVTVDECFVYFNR